MKAWAAAVVVGGACLLPLAAGARAPAPGPAHASPRATYMERCAGCHGFDGRSASRLVPDLKGRAGYFLCSAQGRDYMGRLPNIVFSSISDRDMAALLNYVAFGLGQGSAPRGARGFSAEESGRLRLAPLSSTDLKGYRRAVVDRLVQECGAPEALRTEYGAPATP